ncbi:MAG: ABC transporter ATP-binding protein [Alphaproteobacteria bacterium]|nr:ABC transporter ATP-binding protein [Alphaproteobacteria bacterium]
MIEVSNLSRFYGRFCAVDDVSFSISDGEVVGFLGRNGAGKSTTLKVLAGLLTPSSGTVVVDGVDMTDAPTGFRQRIGFLPETPPLYDDMTVRDFLSYVGSLRGMSAGDLPRRIDEVARKTDIADRLDQLISELSHGYRKRVGIAQAILHRPKLVILDEPISGLDPAQIREMRRVIRALAQESTVLISSHNLHEISATCDRILVLRKGALVREPDGAQDPVAPTIGGLAGGPARHHVALTLRGDGPAIEQHLKDSALVEGQSLKVGPELVLAYVLMHEDRVEELVEGLVRAGFGVRRVEDGLSTQLEDVFLDLTAEAK